MFLNDREKPLAKFERIRHTFLGVAPKGAAAFADAMRVWLGGKLYQAETLREELAAIDPSWAGELLFSEHHLSHAASAFRS